MKQKLLVILVLSLLPLITLGQQADSIRLFFLGGQSNMNGYGKTSELNDSLKSAFSKVWIFQGNPTADEALNGGLGKWGVLQPGHGSGFSSDGENNKLSDRFGIELSFVKKLQQLYPGDKIALIKYAKGGSSIDQRAAGQFGSWDINFTGTNGINQYDNFLITIREAFKNDDIDGDGNKDVLVPNGILWMQGESDATNTEEVANQYYANLSRLLDLIRASMYKDDIPVVLGKISDSGNVEGGKVWKYGELIQAAQEKYARIHDNAAIVRSTKTYNYSDPWHYDTDGYIDLGEKFADAIYKLNKK